MVDKFSIKSRRKGVVLMYISTLTFFTLFLIGEYSFWNGLLVTSTLIFLCIACSTFYLSIVKPGIWKLYRTKSNKLDEREKGVVLDSVRLSYNIFGVISLLLILCTVMSVRYNILALTHRGHFSLGLALVMFLDFLIAVLPASIIAWTEKVIEN